MPDVTISYGMLLDFIAFFRCFITEEFEDFIPELRYLHQTFTDTHILILDMSEVTASYVRVSYLFGF